MRVLVTGTQEEAAAMRRFLVARGVDTAHVLAESRSADTLQNAVYTAQFLLAAAAAAPAQRDGGTGTGTGVHSVEVVTSAWHVRRARSYFEPVFGAYGVLAPTRFTGAWQPPPGECAAGAGAAAAEEEPRLQARKEELLTRRSAPVLRAVVARIEHAQAEAHGAGSRQ